MEPGQNPVDGTGLGSERGEQGFGVAGLALFGERLGGGELRPCLELPVGPVFLPTGIGGNRHHHRHGAADGIFAVAPPEPFRPFLAQLLVDFAKDVGHARPSARSGQYRRPAPPTVRRAMGLQPRGGNRNIRGAGRPNPAGPLWTPPPE